MTTAALLTLGAMVLPGIIGLFHKDDPADPKLDPAQGVQMWVQQMMPMMLMMSMSKDEGEMNPLLLIMLMGGMVPWGAQSGSNPMTQFQAWAKQVKEMQAQMDEMQALLEDLTKKK